MFVRIWNWLRNTKNFVVVTAIFGAIGYIWDKFPSTDKPSPPLHVNINVDASSKNSQINTLTIPSSPEAPKSQPVTQKNPTTPKKSLSPVHYQLAAGVPVEIIPGFWITLKAYSGVNDNLAVLLSGSGWSDSLTFKIGGAPFDFSHNGRVYHLTVDSLQEERVIISIRS